MKSYILKELSKVFKTYIKTCTEIKIALHWNWIETELHWNWKIQKPYFDKQ